MGHKLGVASLISSDTESTSNSKTLHKVMKGFPDDACERDTCWDLSYFFFNFVRLCLQVQMTALSNYSSKSAITSLNLLSSSRLLVMGTDDGRLLIN